MPARPAAPIKANQSVITGPNRPPIRLVPQRCAANSSVKTMAAIGSTSRVKLGEVVSSPSTADRTEIAGVMTLSP